MNIKIYQKYDNNNKILEKPQFSNSNFYFKKASILTILKIVKKNT